jgi:hypothetical protein
METDDARGVLVVGGLGKGKRKGRGQRLQVPLVPVVFGGETIGKSDSDPENVLETEFQSHSCPFPSCPDFLLHKSRRGLISHLSSKHVACGQSNGQRVPRAEAVSPSSKRGPLANACPGSDKGSGILPVPPPAGSLLPYA